MLPPAALLDGPQRDGILELKPMDLIPALAAAALVNGCRGDELPDRWRLPEGGRACRLLLSLGSAV